jgi:cyanophycinase
MNALISSPKPLYLLADSRLLFCKENDRLLVQSALEHLQGGPACAAYIGASNGDRGEFFEIFAAAMDGAGVTERHMIRSAFAAGDRAILERAQVIVLAGGDVEVGWTVFEKTGMKDIIRQRYADGAVLIGVSAGAIQLGRYAAIATPESNGTQLLDMFNFVPLVVDVHDEPREWTTLSSTIHLLEGAAVGLGIPSGGGVIVHPDATIEPVRHPAHEFVYDGARVTHTLLCPPAPA